MNAKQLFLMRREAPGRFRKALTCWRVEAERRLAVGFRQSQDVALKPVANRRSAWPWRAALAGLALGAWQAGLEWAGTARANPPAPYNLLYGMVRDAYGTPLTTSAAQVLLQTTNGVVVSGAVLPGYAPGVNYQIKVPMDFGTGGSSAYRGNALPPAVPFKIYVVVNGVTNLPIEMIGSFATLGQPAQGARMDVTVGVDANGDGIPDQWEYAFLAALGLNVPLSSVNANSVLTPDGRTLRQQYLLGAYPYLTDQILQITFAGFHDKSPDLTFPVITGRYYAVLASADAKTWSPVSFFLPDDDPAGAPRTYYYAPAIGTAEVYVVPPTGTVRAQFYRIQVQ